MSSIGTGYDQECITLSPDGRVFQVEYAAKAADNSGTALGVRCQDGVNIAVDKPLPSATMLASSNRRVHNIDAHIGMTCAGLLSDSRYVLKEARKEAQNYRNTWSEDVPIRIITDRVGEFIHTFTLYSHYRARGCSVLIAGTDGEQYGDACRPQLYGVDPTGMVRGYYATAIGRNKQNVRAELEKFAGPGREIPCDREAVKRIAKVLVDSRENAKKDSSLAGSFSSSVRWQIEMMWISKDTMWKCVRVPDELVSEAVAQAQQPPQAEDDEL